MRAAHRSRRRRQRDRRRRQQRRRRRRRPERGIERRARRPLPLKFWNSARAWWRGESQAPERGGGLPTFNLVI